MLGEREVRLYTIFPPSHGNIIEHRGQGNLYPTRTYWWVWPVYDQTPFIGH